MLRLGLADAAIVGGVDTLCGSVLFGFNALQLVSPDPCRPFDAERNGISIGEAAGFALLERALRRRRRRPRPARLRRIERRAPHVDAASRRPRRRARARRRPGPRRRRRERDRPHQPARHRQPQERRGRGGAGGAALPGAHPRDLDQGLHRPHPRRRRNRRGRGQPAGDRARLPARHRQHANARSGLRAADPDRAGRRRGAAGAQQLVRLRRQQLRPGARPKRRGAP